MRVSGVLLAVFLTLAGTSVLVQAQGVPVPGEGGTAPSQSLPAAAEPLIQPDIQALEERLTAKWETRKDQLETERKALDMLFTAATYLGVVIVAVAVGLTFIVGKSFYDLRRDAKETALSAVEAAIRDKSGVGKDLEETAEEVRNSSARLKEIETELSGYVALRDMAKTVSGSDPMAGFWGIRTEVGERRQKTVRLLSGDDSIILAETTHDAEFRQRASVVFDTLLRTVQTDIEAGRNRVSGNDLFNAAATAAEVDLDYIALELMEAAFAIDKGVHPEIEARLIRQQHGGSKITPAEARDKISVVLARVTGFDLHLVVSEAFNIGQQLADPVGMADLIREKLPAELKNISYVWLNGARLLFMGSAEADWKRAEEWYCKGLEALSRESRTARWYEHSMKEIGDILEERPDLIDACKGISLVKLLGKSPSPQDFARRFGAPLANALIRIGKFDLFLAEGEEAERMQALLKALRSAPDGAAPEEADKE